MINAAAPRLGLVVNPVAGLGGPAGLKGSDGAAIQAAARAAGVLARAGERARQALASLPDGTPVLTGPGDLGEDMTREAGMVPVPVDLPDRTGTGADTRVVTAALVAAGAELVLFAGGDGTARDVAAGLTVSGSRIPVLGVPAGVKMYSACFAVSPQAAGALAAELLAGSATVVEAEVLDVDEEQVRTGRVDPRLFALVRTPAHPQRSQGRKVATPTGDGAAVAGVAAGLAEQLRPGVTYLVGPGGTTAALLRRLGLAGTPLGVDVLRDGELLATDMDETRALAAVGASHDGNCGRGDDACPGAGVVVGVVGGQGFLFGRGNQQLSARVLTAALGGELARDRLLVGATERKLTEFGGRPLLIDTGEPGVDRALAGMLRVTTGPGRTSMYPATAANGV